MLSLYLFIVAVNYQPGDEASPPASRQLRWLAVPPTGHSTRVKSKRRDPMQVPDSTAAFALTNDEKAPGQARRAVRGTLARWRLPTVIDNAVLAVSELVTNAVRHGLPPIGLHLRRRAGQVRIEVDDARPDMLESATASDQLPESGRGLGIVAQVADELGSAHIPGDGKVVYASWDITDLPAEDGPSHGLDPPVSTTP